MPSSPLLTLHRPTPKQALAAAIIFLITALILRSAALAHFSTHYLGGSERDAGLYIWLVKSNLRDLFSLPWFDTKAFYPYGQALAWSDNFIIPSLIIWPLTKLGLALPAAYNTVLLGAQILNGLALFLLSFAVYGAWTPALVAGVAAVSSSTLTQHLGHPQLQFIFWIPLGMLAALRLAERPTLLRAIIPGLLLVGSFLCTVYYTVFLALALCVMGLALLLLRSTKNSITILVISAIGTLMAALLLLPFAGPYIHTHAAFGARKLYEMYYFEEATRICISILD